MPIFSAILSASPEQVVDLFYSSGVDMTLTTADQAAEHLKLNTGQLTCALGFNYQIREMMDIVFVLGYDSLEKFLQQRNRYFVSDAYNQLSLKQVLSISRQVLSDTSLPTSFVAKLLAKRAKMLEQKIEKSVKPKLIENYRAEIKAIYKTKNIPNEFIQIRLKNKDSGFRALLDEVNLIIDSKAISATDLFALKSILPEEKRRIIARDLIPKKIIEQRLTSKNLSDQERRMLENHLSVAG